MRNALVIAAREFEEKRFVAYAALAFAALPFLIGMVPMINGRSPREAVVTLAVILATGFTAGLGVITGAGLVGRDLSDGRMSFYFSRPVGAASIWFGKLTAGIVLVVGCFGLIAAPASFIGGSWRKVWDVTFTQLATVVLPVALGLFLIAHVIGTFARSRSPLIVVDFVAAIVCGLAIRLLLLPLAAGSATSLINWLLIALAAALTLAIVGGGAWQLERGRTDRRRNHLALSQFLWTFMAGALLLAAGYVVWVTSAQPADITRDVIVSHAAGTPFVTVAGKTASRGDYTSAWLMNTEDGRNIRIDAHSSWGVNYTRDGRSALWHVVYGNTAELRRYTRGDAGPIDTGLTVWGDYIFPSDDGSRIATVNHGLLSIYDVTQKRSMASVRIADGKYARGLFITPDLFRLYLQTESALQVFELDVPAKVLRATGTIPPPFVFLSLDPAASRMVVRMSRSNVVTLNDARTGAVIRTLLTGTDVSIARYLRDGRIIVTDTAQGTNVMHVFAPDGTPIREIALGNSPPASFAGDDGTLVALMTDVPGGRELVAVDLNRGVIERRETDVSEPAHSSSNDLRPGIAPIHEVVYKDKQNHVMAWNPATGAKRRIAG
ncbi:MAG: hypothetical protein QOC81_2609 [Thermoanaerobaculia bacterium]|jgi:ABC-type transport system involved in multi-copper enzyme maturation permease subunit|nr:hypothetical protein [Thermoanaerobaculia bacterium]